MNRLYLLSSPWYNRTGFALVRRDGCAVIPLSLVQRTMCGLGAEVLLQTNCLVQALSARSRN